MLIKNAVFLEVEKDDRKYQLTMPVNAPLGEVYQVVGEMMDEVIKLINEHAQKRKDVENSVNSVESSEAIESSEALAE